jgi:hypothetical protein
LSVAGVAAEAIRRHQLLGLSAISPVDYMLGTLAALPALLGYVPLGAFAGRPIGLDRRRAAGGCAYRRARRQSCGRRANAASLNRALS